MRDMSLTEFLRTLSTANGGDALELISRYQSGVFTVAGIGAEDFEEDKDNENN